MRWLAQDPVAVAFVLASPLLGLWLVLTGRPFTEAIGLCFLVCGVLSVLHTTLWLRNAGDIRSDTKPWANVTIAVSAVVFGLFLAAALFSRFALTSTTVVQTS